MPLPALSESARLRYTVLTLLYAAQGIPFGLLIIAVPAFLAGQDVSAAVIGSYVGVTLLPTSFKLVLGPPMDRWTYLPMGRRRPWLLAGQTGLIACFLGMALLGDPAEHIAGLMVLGVVTWFMVSVQDVATDGMAIDVVPVDEQPRANGFMWGGVVLGGAAATAGGAWVMERAGFTAAVLIAAGVLGLIMLLPLLLRERPGERLLPWSEGRASEVAAHLQLDGWADIGRSLWRAAARPASLLYLATVFLPRAGLGLLVVLSVLTVQDLGWAETTYANYDALSRLIGGVLAMSIGGWVVQRVGWHRAIVLFGVPIAMLSGALALAPAWWPESGVLPGYIIAMNVSTTLLMVALLSLAMALCSPRIAATQFALYMAVANLGTSAGSALVGPVEAAGGYAGVIGVAGVCFGAGALLSLTIDVGKHRQRLRLDEPEEEQAPIEYAPL